MAADTKDIIAFFEGSNAFDDGQPITSNFYDAGTTQHSEFALGWNDQSNVNDGRSMRRTEINAAYLIEASNADREYKHALKMADQRRNERLQAMSTTKDEETSK